jgi:MarR family transcriptional regulator, organic hydroperoxide resistance regulator
MADEIAALKLDNQLCFALYSTAHALTKAYAPLLDRLGLTYPQYLAMLVLWEGEGITVKELGARLFLDSGTLTPLLKRLEAAGLVRRARDKRDERQVRISLTEAGTALRDQAVEVPRGIACAIGLPLDEILALKAELEKLRTTLQQA